MDTLLMPANIRFSSYNCNLEDNQIMMDLLSAFGPNWLLHPFSDDSGPSCVDVFDMLENGFQERMNVGQCNTFTGSQYNKMIYFSKHDRAAEPHYHPAYTIRHAEGTIMVLWS